jgi:hypothetical protein
MQTTRLTRQWLGIIALGMGAWPPSARAQSCTTDAECAPPLACRPGATTCTQSGSRSPDGGITMSDPVCVSDPPTCTWVLTACQSDAECTQPSWACMLLVGAEPPTSICFPEGIDCSVGQPCPAGWSCVDFANVKEKDMREMWLASSSNQFCWPDVLGGVPNKTTRVDSTAARLGGGSDAGTLAPTSGKGSGCSMLGRAGAPGLWLSLVLALAWRIGRRRTAGQAVRTVP